MGAAVSQAVLNRYSVLLGSAVCAVIATQKVLSDRYGDLQDVITFSAQLIAVMRAAESSREDALFVDPFAAVLAGTRAMQRHKRRRAKVGGQATSASGGKRLVNNIVCRTVFLDTFIVRLTSPAALPSPAANDVLFGVHKYIKGVQQHIATLISAGATPAESEVPFTQVVLLGAGMDTRAWRLPLQRSVAWFEVDQQRLFDNKLRTLKRCDAQITDLSDSSSLEQRLSCGTYRAVGTGLTADCDLASVLTPHGFDPSLKTLWVLEGLTYYLDEAEIKALFLNMARASAPCSVFTATILTQSCVQRIQPGADRNTLMAHFKWGCPQDFDKAALEWGWQLLDVVDYGSIATMCNCEFPRLRNAADAAASGTPPAASPALPGAALDFSGDRAGIVSGMLKSPIT